MCFGVQMWIGCGTNTLPPLQLGMQTRHITDLASLKLLAGQISNGTM